jgi:hypothetical protein
LEEENKKLRLFIGLLQDGLMKASKKKFEGVMAKYGEILMAA